MPVEAPGSDGVGVEERGVRERCLRKGRPEG